MNDATYKEAIDAYAALTDIQKQRFFPGKEYEAAHIGSAIRRISRSNISIYSSLILYITIYTRLMMGMSAERICITLKMRFSDTIPPDTFYDIISFVDLHRKNIYFCLSNDAELEEVKNYSLALHAQDSKTPDVHIDSDFAKKIYDKKSADNTDLHKRADVVMTSLVEEGKHDEAISFADSIISFDTDGSITNDRLIYHFDNNAEFFCAVAYMKEWDIQRTLCMSSDKQQIVLFKKAYSQYELRKHEAAIETLTDLLQIAPFNLHARTEIVQNYFQLEDYEKGVAVIETAIQFALLPKEIALCLRTLGHADIEFKNYRQALMEYRYSCLFEKSSIAVNEILYIMSCDPHLRTEINDRFFESLDLEDVKKDGLLFTFSKPQRFAFEAMCAFSDLQPDNEFYKEYKNARPLLEKLAVFQDTTAKFLDSPILIESPGSKPEFRMNPDDLIVVERCDREKKQYVCPNCGKKVESSILCPNCKYVFTGIERMYPSDNKQMEEEQRIEAHTVFEKYLSEISSIARRTAFFSEEKTMPDIASLVYVIADYAAASAKKDRLHIASDIEDYYLNCNAGSKKRLFYERAQFYGSIIRGRQLVGCCLPGVNLNSLDDNACVRCAIAFCDCMVSPELIEDYDNGPLRLNGIFEMMSFAPSVLHPVMEALVNLFKDVYDKVDDN